MQVAGKQNRKTKEEKPPPIDRIHRAYRQPCIDLSDRLGWDKDIVADWFEQFTFMHMKEQGMAKNLAAFVSMRDLLAFFDKAGNDFD
jgi:hypothetical protein